MKLDELEVLLNNADSYRQNQHEYDASQRLREAVIGQQARIAELEALVLKLEDDNCRIFDAEVVIRELESAVQHADKVVEQLTAERDAALERAEKAEEHFKKTAQQLDALWRSAGFGVVND